MRDEVLNVENTGPPIGSAVCVHLLRCPPERPTTQEWVDKHNKTNQEGDCYGQSVVSVEDYDVPGSTCFLVVVFL